LLQKSAIIFLGVPFYAKKVGFKRQILRFA